MLVTDKLRGYKLTGAAYGTLDNRVVLSLLTKMLDPSYDPTVVMFHPPCLHSLRASWEDRPTRLYSTQSPYGMVSVGCPYQRTILSSYWYVRFGYIYNSNQNLHLRLRVWRSFNHPSLASKSLIRLYNYKTDNQIWTDCWLPWALQQR